MDKILAEALRLRDATVSTIPIKRDGTKAPDAKRLPRDPDDPKHPTWKPYQERLPTEQELASWFQTHQAGLAIVAGRVSGNVEILDFDRASLLRPWYDLVEAVAPGLVARLVIVQTPSNGRHAYYRCATIGRNQKLAVSADRQVMIETRGEGGYAIIPPSPSPCHPLNRPYRLRQGDLAQIPMITEDERDILLNCARALTHSVEPERVYTPRHPMTTDGTRPGDLFAAAATWEEILTPHGWRIVGHRGEVELWCRPGKAHGVSATTGWSGSDLLYVFSTNAAPFEAERGYSKFTAYTLLNFGTNEAAFHHAAVDLAAKGFLQRHERRQGAGGIRTTQTRRPFRTIVAKEVIAASPLRTIQAGEVMPWRR